MRLNKQDYSVLCNNKKADFFITNYNNKRLSNNNCNISNAIHLKILLGIKQIKLFC